MSANASPPLRVWLLLLGVAGVIGIDAAWCCFGARLEAAEPLRLTAGACLIFVLPGLLAGELLGLRGRSPLETIAVAFALTLTLEIGLLAVVVGLGAAIELWVGLLLGITALQAVGVAAATARGRRPVFLTGLVSLPPGTALARALHAGIIVAPFLLGALAYGWGEQVADLGGEKYIHMTFVRYYAEMPLVLANLGIEQGAPPPNLVHLWEFLIAGWAACVRIDPLPVFAHARMVVPVLGLAGMFLLTRLVFIDWKKSTAVFAGVLLLATGQVLRESACLQWIDADDPTRGVLAFFGTAHHADSALDILLGLTAGVGLLFLRQPRPAHALLFAGVLAANFLWHPREFLQAALYLGMLGPVALLLPTLRTRALLGRWLAALGILGGTAAIAAMLSAACVPPASHGYDESALKRTALAYALQPGELGTVRSLFNYPLHLLIANPMTPDRILSRAEVDDALGGQWNLDRWTFLAAAATIVLVLFGRRHDRALACYHLLLWLLAYAWNFSLLLILALTYAEFFMAMPRLLYLFSYLVIADGALVAVTALVRVSGGAGPAPALLVVAAGHYALTAWMGHGHPGGELVATALNVGCWGLLVAVYGCAHPRWSALGIVRAARRPLPLALSVLALAAALWPDNVGQWPGLFARATSAATAPDWFGPANPFGYSPELRGWLRTVPPGRRFATNPLDLAMPSVYVPQYLCVQPVASVIADHAERRRAAAGRHPFYRPRTPVASPPIDPAQAAAWLRERRADYVLLTGADYAAPVLAYFHAYPERYQVAFDNSIAGEAAFRVLSDPASGGR